MARRASILSAGLLAAACAGPSDAVPTPRDAAEAEQFVATSLARQFPAYPAPAAAATCVRENATDREILLLAGSVPTARPEPRQRLGVAIATRPETQACFTSKNLPRLR